MVMTHTHAEISQRSVDSKDRVETDGWTDTTDCSTLPANAVVNKLSRGEAICPRRSRQIYVRARTHPQSAQLWWPGLGAARLVTIRYDTRCYFNVHSKADMNRLNLPHGDDN